MKIHLNDPTETLPVLIDQATHSLANARTYAEVLEVKGEAQVIYDAAKSAARMARAKQAHDSMLVGVHEAQGKALAIFARAEIRLAEEYEAAQDRGEVAKQGEQDRARDNIPAGNVIPATAAEIGVDPKDIHNGRKLKAAEDADPGVIERSIGELVEAGEEPTKAALARKIDVVAKPEPKVEPEPDPVAYGARVVWGILWEFQDEGIVVDPDPGFLGIDISLDPQEVLAKMTDPMMEDVRRLLPLVTKFLNDMMNSDAFGGEVGREPH